MGDKEWRLAQAVVSDERFRRWLLEELFEGGPRMIVGRTVDNRRCPLACWLTDSMGEQVLVDISRVSLPYSYDREFAELPRWGQAFLDLVDAANQFGQLATVEFEARRRETVTAAQALAFLDMALVIAGRG